MVLDVSSVNAFPCVHRWGSWVPAPVLLLQSELREQAGLPEVWSKTSSVMSVVSSVFMRVWLSHFGERDEKSDDLRVSN